MRTLAIHQSLHRHSHVMGAERELVLISGLVALLVAPGVVLCKDGSFLAAWEFRGQDTASSTPEELAFVSAQVNSAIKLLGTGWMLHVDAVRCRQRAYSPQTRATFRTP